MKHPSSLDLEAFACGEPDERVERHVVECAACRDFVARARSALSAWAAHARADEQGALAARAGEGALPADRRGSSARRVARRRWIAAASTLAAPLAAAAALVFLVRSPAAPVRGLTPKAPDLLASAEATRASTSPTAETTFKGGVQAAIIRDRAGAQERLVEDVRVEPGDRLRVEIGLDHEQVITAALLGDDGSWLELLPGTSLGPGTHFSERAARVDASPMSGTLLVGAPDAVARARASRATGGAALDGVTAIRIRWEAP